VTAPSPIAEAEQKLATQQPPPAQIDAPGAIVMPTKPVKPEEVVAKTEATIDDLLSTSLIRPEHQHRLPEVERAAAAAKTEEPVPAGGRHWVGSALPMVPDENGQMVAQPQASYGHEANFEASHKVIEPLGGYLPTKEERAQELIAEAAAEDSAEAARQHIAVAPALAPAPAPAPKPAVLDGLQKLPPVKDQPPVKQPPKAEAPKPAAPPKAETKPAEAPAAVAEAVAQATAPETKPATPVATPPADEPAQHDDSPVSALTGAIADSAKEVVSNVKAVIAAAKADVPEVKPLADGSPMVESAIPNKLPEVPKPVPAPEPVPVAAPPEPVPVPAADLPQISIDDTGLPQAESLAADDVAKSNQEAAAKAAEEAKAPKPAEEKPAEEHKPPKIIKHDKRQIKSEPKPDDDKLPEEKPAEKTVEAPALMPTTNTDKAAPAPEPEAAPEPSPVTGKLILPTGEKPASVPSAPKEAPKKPSKLAKGEVFVDEHGNVTIGE